MDHMFWFTDWSTSFDPLIAYSAGWSIWTVFFFQVSFNLFLVSAGLLRSWLHKYKMRYIKKKRQQLSKGQSLSGSGLIESKMKHLSHDSMTHIQPDVSVEELLRQNTLYNASKVK